MYSLLPRTNGLVTYDALEAWLFEYGLPARVRVFCEGRLRESALAWSFEEIARLKPNGQNTSTLFYALRISRAEAGYESVGAKGFSSL